MSPRTGEAPASRTSVELAERFRTIRRQTEALCEPLEIEDYSLQSMVKASPPKWHLGHTTWFYEEFVLSRRPDYQVCDGRFRYLFNSYYDSVGVRQLRSERGLLSRPTVRDVYGYRSRVDESLVEFIRAGLDPQSEKFLALGLQHEQQHQELLLTDLKHAFSKNALMPHYVKASSAPAPDPASPEWVRVPEGLYEVGVLPSDDPTSFAYDNEGPRHRVQLPEFEISSQLVTCRDYVQFMNDGGYSQSEYWLSDGWVRTQDDRWIAPEYWFLRDGEWWLHTLTGPRPLCLDEPITHVSFYEADAFARWAGHRLPTEFEWEVAVAVLGQEQSHPGHFLHSLAFHPATESGVTPLGNVWVWTASSYAPYPGYQREPGALGEYNGKFMCNQVVLRGGSCVTPESHIRSTYRNFFPPETRWQFSGIRLAR